MKFTVGYELAKFKRYYKTAKGLHEYYRTLGSAVGTSGELGAAEEYWVKNDPTHLIMWRENSRIVGHAIWHETSTDEMKKGDPREEEDREMLRKLLGGKKDNIVELHEVWLKKEHRGKGYGKMFFEFFEQYIRNRGFDAIVYYTAHPAAMKICRKRGYKEGFLPSESWYVFCFRLR